MGVWPKKSCFEIRRLKWNSSRAIFLCIYIYICKTSGVYLNNSKKASLKVWLWNWETKCTLEGRKAQKWHFLNRLMAESFQTKSHSNFYKGMCEVNLKAI